MINRRIDPKLFKDSTFLLDPRQVGKSTYLKTHFPQSLYIDLLDGDFYFRYSQRPGEFAEHITYQLDREPSYSTVPIIVDEVQRIPQLLNEVHRMIESQGLVFTLCGSSARKLLRGGANMLGGRAGRVEMRGLTIAELGQDFNLLKLVNDGSVPSHYLSDNADKQIKAYVQNYLQEEIKGEALVRNLRSFNQFLELVGITNTEEVNYASIARDVGVDAKTVKEYFQILVDTLVGSYLEPYSDKQKRTNILKSPKFYLFDTGIANYLNGVKLQKEVGAAFGKSFQHVIFNEIQTYRSYSGNDFGMSFWRTYEQDEVDFILGDAEVAIEVKGTNSVRESDLRSLSKFADAYHPKKVLVVSNEKTPRKLSSGIEVLPYREFSKLLWGGGVI